MNREYISAAMTGAQYKTLSDDGSWYGEIPGLQGVYSNADTLEECRKVLEEVLEEWLLLRFSLNLAVPGVTGVDFPLHVNDG